MRTRTAAFAVAAAALGVLAGCGDNSKCSDQTPPIAGVPSCTALASTQVTVPIHVCPRCDQGPTTCTVDMANIASNVIELVPLSPVCDANASCPIPDPPTCPFATANCTFTAPAAVGIYNLVVVDATGAQIPNKQLDVVSSGTPSCSGFNL